MEKTKKNFTEAIIAVLSLIIAAVFAISVFPFSAFNAHADDEEQSQTIYYYSDYYDAEDYCNGLFADIISEYELCHPDGSELKLKYKSMQNMGTLEALEYYEGAIEDSFYSISNSFVIIEIRNSLDYNPKAYNEDILKKLKDIFSLLKNANCKTMFICDTDEYLFKPQTEFLDYVDVHINTDLMLGFMQNVLRVLEEEGGLQGKTILLDGVFATDWFYRLCLMKCIAAKYEDDLYSQKTGEMIAFQEYLKLYPYIYFDCSFILEVLDLTLIIHEGGNKFINAVTQDSLNEIEYENLFYNNDMNLCIITSTYWYDETYDLEEFIYDLQEYHVNEIPTFVYNTSNYISEFSFYCKQGGISRYWLDYYIEEIIREFVFDGDLEQYNNYEGKCAITFKPIFAGDSGWMTMDIEEWSLMKIVET